MFRNALLSFKVGVGFVVPFFHLKDNILSFCYTDLAFLLPLLSLPGGAVELLGRNTPSILRMTKGMDPNISRLCIQSHEEGQHQPKSKSFWLTIMLCFVIQHT